MMTAAAGDRGGIRGTNALEEERFQHVQYGHVPRSGAILSIVDTTVCKREFHHEFDI
jgi:hypothetical protein